MRNEGKISPDQFIRIEEWIINKGYRDNIPGHVLTVKLHVSQEALNQYCRKYFNLTFKETICRLKVLDAMDIMVREPEIPTGSIRLIVGVSDRSNLRKAFLKYSGLTPLQWKDAITGKASASERL